MEQKIIPDTFSEQMFIPYHFFAVTFLVLFCDNKKTTHTECQQKMIWSNQQISIKRNHNRRRDQIHQEYHICTILKYFSPFARKCHHLFSLPNGLDHLKPYVAITDRMRNSLHHAGFGRAVTTEQIASTVSARSRQPRSVSVFGRANSPWTEIDRNSQGTPRTRHRNRKADNLSGSTNWSRAPSQLNFRISRWALAHGCPV